MADNTTDGKRCAPLRSVRRTARELGIPEQQLLRALRRGELPGYRIGLRTILLKEEEVLRWLDAHRYRPPRSAARRVQEAASRNARP